MAEGASAGPPDGRARAVVLAVWPEVDGGLTAIKRVPGQHVDVEADVVADGHDELRVVLRHRATGEASWREKVMAPLGNDRYGARFTPRALGGHAYTVVAWVARYATWARNLRRWAEAGEAVDAELEEGARLIDLAAAEGGDPDRRLARAARILRAGGDTAQSLAADAATVELVEAALAPHHPVPYARVLRLNVERERASFGAWYEMFPRSAGPAPGVHGTLKDVERRLPNIRAMGFDVLYLPPLSPIGATARKGPGNAGAAGPDDVGSPWAVGGPDGGHTAVHRSLGTKADLERLIAAAQSQGVEIALDLALQCSPDHPWVREHPTWFRHRTDGAIRYAENPPKRYQDIYPLDFESDDWQDLWHAVLDIVRVWLGMGIRLFRVDNPHTKPIGFWRWLIAEVQREWPDAVFLAEAFTRPKLMYALAKAGFSQSYTYFAWRERKDELEAYVAELFESPVREFFRPNLWTNTPDILTAYLQRGGPPAFATRLILAATLARSYGIYGPAFELCYDRSAGPGQEEYLHSEKYELRHWHLDDPLSLAPLISRLNAIRHGEEGFGPNAVLRLWPCDNPELIAYSRRTPGLGATLLVVVNLDPLHAQSGFVHLEAAPLGLPQGAAFTAHDLLDDARYPWREGPNYVALSPDRAQAHVLRLEPESATAGGAP